MTDEEWAELATKLWRWCWPYGTQQDKAELLIIQAQIEAGRHPLGTPEQPGGPSVPPV